MWYHDGMQTGPQRTLILEQAALESGGPCGTGAFVIRAPVSYAPDG
jgi:hypothetical protein